MRVRLFLLAAVASVLAAAPRNLVAQGCGIDPPCPTVYRPSVRISPATHTHVTDASLHVVAMISDANPLDSSSLSPSGMLSAWTLGVSAVADKYVTLVPGDNTIIVDIADLVGTHGADTVVITYDPPPTPLAEDSATLSLAPHSNTLRHLIGCSGCLYGAYSYSTPAYISRDVPRSVTLLYSSAQAQPRGLVQLDANINSTDTAAYISMYLDSAGVPLPLTNDSTNAWWNVSNGTGTVRLAVQFDASSKATGSYDYLAYVTTWYGGTPHPSSIAVRALVINESASPLGAGWSIAGLKRLQISGPRAVTITDGSGGIVYFARDSGAAGFHHSAGVFDTLTVSGCGSSCVYSLTSPNGNVERFNAAGLMTTTLTRFGDSTHYGYVSSQLDTIIDEAGKVTLLAYSSGKLTSITTPGGRTTNVVVNGSGDLERIVGPAGDTAFVGTYSNHMLVAAVDRLKGSTAFAYDTLTGISSITSPSVTVTDTSGSTTSASTVITYKSLESQLLSRSYRSAWFIQYAVHSDTAFARVTTPNGTVTRMILQGVGEPTRVEVHPLAGYVQTTTTAYNSDFLPTSITTSPIGGTTTYTWSGANLSSTTDPNGVATNFAYESTYHQVTEIDVQGSPQQINRYGGTYLTLDSTFVGKDTTIYTWDAHGRVTESLSRQSHSVERAYESGGFQNTSDTWVGGAHATRAHDHYGRDSVLTNEAGNVSTLAYDVLNRPTSLVQPGSATTTTSYSENTSAHTITTTLTDPRSLVFTSVTNALGFGTLLTDPQSHNDSAGYNVNGALTRAVDRNGHVTTFQYDSLGRVLAVRAGSDTATFAYDNNTGVTDAHFVVTRNAVSIDTLVTDATGRLGADNRHFGSLSILASTSYDAYGNRGMLSISPGSYGTLALNFGYDTLQRPNLLPDWGNNYTQVRYTNEQLLDTLIYPTTSSSSTRLRLHPSSYNDFGRPAVVQTSIGSSVVSTANYWYDALGRITQIVTGPSDNALQRSFTYDGRGRLAAWADTSVVTRPDSVVDDCPDPMQIICDPPAPVHYFNDVTRTGLRGTSYSPDNSGNRTDGSASYTHDRLMSVTGADGRAYTLAYDSAGFLLSKTASGYSQTYGWNTLGQLIWVKTGSDSVAYGYDASGLRVRQTHGGVKIFYVWDSGNLMMQTDSAGTPTFEYSYLGGLDQPLAVKTGGALYYYLLDQQGNVEEIRNTSNSQVATYDYDPYGYGLATSASLTQPLRWKGAQLDSTGLYYLRARYYDPTIGRFISEDPIGLAGGINPYVFANGEPVNHADPTGTCTLNILYLIMGDGTKVYSGKQWLEGDDCAAILNEGNKKNGGGGDSSSPDVHGHVHQNLKCSANASQVMAAVESNFSRFADYSTGPFSVTFSPQSTLAIGSTIPIKVGYFGLTQSMGVRVQAMSGQGMMFQTLPGGHLLYPATIAFTASDAPNGSINFNITYSGDFNGPVNEAKFFLGGKLLEEAQWNHFQDQVATFCKGGA